jgi:hypothetical protein
VELAQARQRRIAIFVALWHEHELIEQMLRHNLSALRIMEAIGVSMVYATEIRNGQIVPHKRHWVKLAELVGVSVGQ